MNKKFIRKIKEKIKIYFYNSGYYFFKRCLLSQKKNFNTMNEKVKMCFIIQRIEIFPSVQSIFEYMCLDARYDVTLLVLPRFDHATNKINVNTIEQNLKFASQIANGAEVINSYDDQKKKFKRLEDYKFDFIFLGLPYQREYPMEYKFANLSKISRVCYVPYGSSYADGKEMIRTSFTTQLLTFVDYIFCDCIKTYKYCQSKLKYCQNADGKRIVYNIGYPRFDLITYDERKGKKNKTFLWIPRWTTPADDNEKSTFLMYKDFLLNYFSNNAELSLIIRPHPLMFDNYIKKGYLTREDVEKYKNQVKSLKNVMFDENCSYRSSFVQSDCLIADYSSIVIEFLLMGKPVIYLSDVRKIETTIANAFYVSKNVQETKEYIKQLAKGEDGKRQNRLDVLKATIYKKGTCKRIADVLNKI